MCTKRKFGALASLILFSSLCFSQTFEKEKIDLVFGASDPDFETSEVPAEWKNESAVIANASRESGIIFGVTLR